MELSKSAQDSAIESCFSAVKQIVEIGDIKNADFKFPLAKTIKQASDSNDMNEVRALLHSVRASEEIFRTLLAAATDAVARIEDKFNDLVNHSKFADLPEDILLVIFKFAIRARTFPDATIALASVCRRFRSIILRLPVIIDFPRNSNHYATVLALRSSATNLTFAISELCNLSSTMIIGRFNHWLQLVPSMSMRLTAIRLNLNNIVNDTYLRRIFDAFSGVSLPNVSEFELKCIITMGRRCMALCHGLDMPSLRNLIITNVLPQLRADIASKVRSCQIAFDREVWKPGDGSVPWSSNELVDFLRTLTALEHFDASLPLHEETPAEDLLAIDTLRSVVVRLPTSVLALGRNIFNFVAMRNITALDLRVGIRDIAHFATVLEKINDSWREAVPTSVTDLSITLWHDKITAPVQPFMIIPGWCRKFENLKHITLESPRYSAHGLFSFTNGLESFRLSDSEPLEDRVDLLREVPIYWEMGPGKQAVWNAKEVWEMQSKYMPSSEMFMNLTRFVVNDSESDDEDT